MMYIQKHCTVNIEEWGATVTQVTFFMIIEIQHFILAYYNKCIPIRNQAKTFCFGQKVKCLVFVGGIFTAQYLMNIHLYKRHHVTIMSTLHHWWGHWFCNSQSWLDNKRCLIRNTVTISCSPVDYIKMETQHTYFKMDTHFQYWLQSSQLYQNLRRHTVNIGCSPVDYIKIFGATLSILVLAAVQSTISRSAEIHCKH